MTKKNTKRLPEKWYQSWVVRNLLTAAIIAILFLLVVTIFLNIITRHNREQIVPDLTNCSVEQAEKIAAEHHLRLELTDSVYVKRMPRGHITRQRPEPGSAVKKNRMIRLTINSVMPRLSTVPDLIGYSLRQARTELQAEGLTVGQLIYVPDIASNNVLAQQLRGQDIAPETKIESETAIDLILGMNNEDRMTYVPNVRGYRFQAAKDLLMDSFLNLGQTIFDETVMNYNDSLNAVVYRITPQPCDTLPLVMGTPVRIELTLDPEKLKQQEESRKQTNEIPTL